MPDGTNTPRQYLQRVVDEELEELTRSLPVLVESSAFGCGHWHWPSTMSLRAYAQAAEARVFHLRTSGGEHEVDLIIEREDGRVLAVEFKLARDIGSDDVRHLNWLAGQLGDSLIDAVVLNTGQEAYRRPDGITVVPAALIGA